MVDLRENDVKLPQSPQRTQRGVGKIQRRAAEPQRRRDNNHFLPLRLRGFAALRWIFPTPLCVLWGLCGFFCLMSFSPIYAQHISVSAEMEQTQVVNQPLKGTITITHDQKEKIDTNSFLLEKEKLPVTFVKDVKISPNDPMILSIYSFTLPAKKEGLYALPEVSVKVEGKIYKSAMSSYTVVSTAPVPAMTVPSPQPSSAPPVTTPQEVPAETVQPSLRLETAIDGSDSLYPGQKTKLVYRYYFTGDIALSTEKVPLLDAEGFIKIGEKEITDSVEGNVSIRQISQQVQAVQPGKFTLGPSLIEGYAYKEDAAGKPVPISDKLSSSAPALTITVLPFPEQNKPASFNGAVGQFTFKTSLMTPNEMTVGDKLSLELQITGKGNLITITIPDLFCQPGFSGFFRLSDLPPKEAVVDDTKKITAEFSPLNPQIKEIPSLEFSFFDPEKGQYTTLHSEPIPIRVNPAPQQPKDVDAESSEPAKERPVKQQLLPKTSAAPMPIEIESLMPLHTCDLYNRLFGTWWAMTILPLSLFLLIYQQHLMTYLKWKGEQRPFVNSEELFLQAFAKRKQGIAEFETLKRSFKLALVEAGLLSSVDIPDKQLPEEGVSKEVKIFCALIDEKLFSGKGTYDIDEIYHLSNELMKRINAVSKTKSRGVSL